MCQLNLYMVSNNVKKEDVISIFEKYNIDICEESYYKLDDMEERYQFYSSSYKCDCKSIISRLQKENVNSFDVYKIKKKDEDIKKLNRMKTLKADKYYETKVKEFENQQEELLNNKEYQNAIKKYQDYITDNKELNESIYYNIVEVERRIAEYDFSDFIDEFNNLKNAYREILNLAKEICIYPFWQDGEVLEIKDKRQIMIHNLDIDDLVFLPYRNLLKIGSVKE